jgi:hypothetical protein
MVIGCPYFFLCQPDFFSLPAGLYWGLAHVAWGKYLIPFLKNNDCLEFLNCPGRGAHALRPYKNASIISCILSRKWYYTISEKQ